MIRIFEPINALHKIVDYIWVVDFDFLADDNREDIIMPLGYINIIFNYGSAYRLVGEDQEMVIPNTVVIGQMKSAKYVRYGQQLYQIGISLTPLGFIQLFHVPSLELAERIVQAIDVDPDLDELYRMMMRFKDVEQHITAINHYLLHKMVLNKKDTGRIEKMLTYVEREYENLNIVSMAKFFSISVSTLERFFKKQIGLTPKAYGDIVKFRKHVEDEGLRKNMQHRYYDQSHLIKTSKKFAGKTVKELEKLPHELTLRYVWHGQK
ncbi:DUF6597 domain-containing transcriptional factor [Paenibacillus etheri]|uniref:HTH araC/xylS-type domain-containing protein n=1 Tax=Paenibacillus etheri TaxID=1306852 RepID=A0A0W1ASC7_9BACL|nr:DUF6597 domain-containing transcriptional factor [Paenibacillus etheri]KTD84162.1 hypothetical protein UQ64_28805 [Paenibacillus etheri]